MPLGLVTNAGHFGKRYEDLEWFGATYDSILQGSFVGKARVEEQDFDGVDAEVLFPSQRTMGAFMAQEDDDYHLAGLEAYNTWMHDEFMAADPERLIGLAQMPGVDVQTSVKWLRDAKAAGYRGVIISAFPSGNAELSAEDDPFWEAAEEEQMPVHIHSGLRQAGKRTAGSFQQAAASAEPDDRPGRDGRSGRRRLAVHVQVHLLGHLRPLPRPADGGGGVRGRLGAALPRAHGRPLLAQPDLDRDPRSRCSRASTSGATGR